MQLGQAINNWVETHGAGLSPATRRDIDHIATSVETSGCHELACDEVDDQVRDDITAAATVHGTLPASAVSEFMNVVLAWSGDQADDGLAPRGVFETSSDRDVNTISTEVQPVTDAQTPSSTQADGVEGDGETQDWGGYLGRASVSEVPGDLPVEAVARPQMAIGDDNANSFLDAIGASTSDGAETIITGGADNATDAASPPSGVFSAAAEPGRNKTNSSIDWITVGYFSIAAICFALVIYFYITR